MREGGGVVGYVSMSGQRLVGGEERGEGRRGGERYVAIFGRGLEGLGRGEGVVERGGAEEIFTTPYSTVKGISHKRLWRSPLRANTISASLVDVGALYRPLRENLQSTSIVCTLPVL